jgi:hypothetical protein
MPPKAAKKGTALPLEGCTIALSGKFPRTQSALEQDFIVGLGATLAKTVSSSTTHLLTTETDFEKPSAKVKQAKSHDVQIVKLAWLEDCLDKATRLKEEYYSFGSTAAAVTANGKVNGSRKRTTDDVEDDSQSQPKKKNKGANGTNTQSQPGANSKSDSKALSSKADVADGLTNIAKSRDILIPVDEQCPLTHYRVYIDDNNVIYDAALNQTNAGHNNNKFYRVQVCDRSMSLSLVSIAKNVTRSYIMAATIKLGLGGAELGIVDRIRYLVLVVLMTLLRISIRSSRTKAVWPGLSEVTNRRPVNILSSRGPTAKIRTTTRRKLLAHPRQRKVKRGCHLPSRH